MKSITETSILSVLFGGIVESAFEEKVLHNTFSRAMQPCVSFEESIDRSKMMISTIIVTSSVFHPVANFFMCNVRTHILTSTISAIGEEKF